MKIVDGVNLHLIQTEKFKTNKLTVRFTGLRRKETVANRVLVAQMLGLANQDYPTHQAFRRALADMYGTTLSTHISVKGNYHILDIDIDFLNNRFLMGQENLLEQVLDFLYNVLYNPLSTLEQFQSTAFDLEKENLITYLKADKEDAFYYSELGLQQLYYHDEDLQISKYANADLVERETSYTAYQEWQKMLREDQIDIFLLGDTDGAEALEKFNQFPFQAREALDLKPYHQERQKIITEKLERRPDNQSILQLGYQVPVQLGHEDFVTYQVLNGMLGAFSHSRLFTEIREKEGLAYTIASHLDPYTGLLQVYAGIDKDKREQVLKLINKQWHDLRFGRFSSQLLQQTKRLIKSQRRIAQDYPKYLIERDYNRRTFGQASSEPKSWEESLDAVGKEAIMHAAKQCQLQAVYYLEGDGD